MNEVLFNANDDPLEMQASGQSETKSEVPTDVQQPMPATENNLLNICYFGSLC